MNGQSELLKLIQNAVNAADSGTVKLSSVIRSCIRIARSRNDFVSLFWLQRELMDIQNEFERRRIFDEMIPHFTKDQFNHFNKLFVEMWMQERPAIVFEDGRIEKIDMIIGKNVSELENELEGMIDTYNRAQTPAGMHPFDTAKLEEQNFHLRIKTQACININHYQKILESIKNCVYDFLSQTEKQLL